MEKQCFKCGQVKPLTEFYKHPMMADGHLGKCKECNKADVSDNYRKRKPQYQAYERKRNKSPERQADRMRHQRVRRERFPEKNLARQRLGYAVRTGKIVPQPCEQCGAKAEAHHDDYSKPLDVHWLCFKHHRAEHGQEAA